MANTKHCPRCSTTKDVSEFGRNAARHDGLTGWCMECQRQAVTDSTRKRRAELLALLGGQCLHCGFSDPRALHIDHVNGDGAEERRQTGNAAAALYKLVKADPSRYQLLCANCNERKKRRNREVGERADGPADLTKAAYQRAAIEASRTQMFALVGGAGCRRCGCGDREVLHIDHVDGGGSEHRRRAPGFYALLRQVRENPAAFQPLCANCNRIKQAEDGEYKGSREYVRVAPTERRASPEGWLQRTPDAADRRQAELAALIEQRRLLERLAERQPRGAWTGFYVRCLGCHTTDSRHACNGVCNRCYKVVNGLTRTRK